MLRLYLIVTNDGYVKFSHYFIYIPLENRPSIEAKVTDLCWKHKDDTCHFFEDDDSIIIFRNFGGVHYNRRCRSSRK
ncbi:hypothetical protein Anas_03268 [Armadillidium nasatum]|uniref:Uncharacterized protein n=1 Tax=Armadillidium nasatum TaxID=96803 RepID=A0A5N5TGY9_9CRUS|nr:hypothetical protein Anas_03268 [Armadillidium nasatum]